MACGVCGKIINNISLIFGGRKPAYFKCICHAGYRTDIPAKDADYDYMPF